MAPEVHSAHIGVTAKSGSRHAHRPVAHYAEKSAAEEAAKGVYGVKGLANDIAVEMVGSLKRTDQDLTEATLNALK